MWMPARSIGFVILVLAVAACQGESPALPTIVDNDYRLKHPIAVEPAIALLQLRADAGHAVSDDDRRRLHDFAGAFIRRGSGAVEISVGAHASDDNDARAYAQDIAQSLQGEGLKARELRLQLVIADPVATPGRAALRFSTSTVNLPPCRDWSDSAPNAPYADFGCTLQRNIGAMVADPHDLEQARDFGPTHSAKQDAAIDRMNRGEATWSVPLPLAATTKSTGGSSGGP